MIDTVSLYRQSMHLTQDGVVRAKISKEKHVGPCNRLQPRLIRMPEGCLSISGLSAAAVPACARRTHITRCVAPERYVVHL